eukprot:7142875-Pyramimonas_sp.AAC.1
MQQPRSAKNLPIHAGAHPPQAGNDHASEYCHTVPWCITSKPEGEDQESSEGKRQPPATPRGPRSGR